MSDENIPKCNCKPAENEVSSDDSKSKSVWRCCIKQRNWLLLKNMRFSDVCFIVGCGRGAQKIHAHKNVLSDSGTVFEAMFGENWSSKSKEIEVPDIEPAIFSALLRFIYTDDIQLTADSVLKILYAAKKYEIVTLENLCSDFLKEQLSPENACMLLSQARLFDQPKLMESCLEVIDERPDDSLTSDGFINIDLTALRAILERDTLQVDEVDVFKAVLRWSAAECARKKLAINGDNLRLVLDGAESLVRFPLMTLKEFASEVVPCGLLSNVEVIDIFQHFSGVPKTLPSFISTPRSSKEPLVVQRFSREVYYEQWRCNGTPEEIGFSFDCSVKLRGFGLFIEYCPTTTKYDINITVKNEGTSDILYQSTVDFERRRVAGSYVFNVLLSKPLKLTANTCYVVITKTQAPYCYFSEYGQESVRVEDPKNGKIATVTFKTTCPNERTRVREGQIPRILFSW